MKKDYIHSIDSTLLSIYEEFDDVRVATRQSLGYLGDVLKKYDIKYEDLRQVLNPGNEVFAYIFNSDEFEERYDYFAPLIDIMLSCIDDIYKGSYPRSKNSQYPYKILKIMIGGNLITYTLKHRRSGL